MEQTKSMGRILHRPAFFDLPEWIVKLAFGEGSTVMLDSKEVYPRVLQEAGFKFLYPTFDSAMEQIVHTQA
jgi:NAD dependent epimerase/dehydratase family enzyme